MLSIVVENVFISYIIMNCCLFLTQVKEKRYFSSFTKVCG